MAINQTQLKHQPTLAHPVVKISGSNWLERALQAALLPWVVHRYGGPVHPQKNELQFRFDNKALFVGDSPNRPSKSALVGQLLSSLGPNKRAAIFTDLRREYFFATDTLESHLNGDIDSGITDNPVLEQYSNYIAEFLKRPGQTLRRKTAPLNKKQIRHNQEVVDEFNTHILKTVSAKFPKTLHQFLSNLDIKAVVNSETLIKMAYQQAEQAAEKSTSTSAAATNNLRPKKS